MLRRIANEAESSSPALIFRIGRRLFFLAGDSFLLLICFVAAVFLRFEGKLPPNLAAALPFIVALSIATKLAVFSVLGLYSFSWSQVGLHEMIAVFRGVTMGSAVLVLALLSLNGVLTEVPRSVLLIDYVLTLFAVAAFRLGRRVYEHTLRPSAREGRRTLIVGAGEAGGQLARSLRYAPTPGYIAVGFIDDDPRKFRTTMHGLKVLGDRHDIPAIVQSRGIEAVLIAIPSGSSRAIRSLVSAAREAGVREIRIIPSLDRILNGRISFTDLRDLELVDLLGREIVRIDVQSVEHWLRGRTVLVTGAGGSVGSELCRQLAQFGPREIALLDWDETGLFWTRQEMQRMHQHTSVFLSDICDSSGVQAVFREVRPQIVIHAAAYKHVGMVERHPERAVLQNILGTFTVASRAAEAGAEKFVLISTDKAVNPTSILGVTKRVAEQVCLALHGRGSTQFLAVRFGNVLGSRGSVIPLFQGNIRRGEPLTVRGPDTRRYFMAAEEAALLVLQASAIGKGGEIFVLDMGEPVRVIDLARAIIRASGLEPDKDVPIILAAPEPGEKECEDLLTAEEGTVATRHDRIFVARVTATVAPEVLLSRLGALEDMVRTRDLEGMIRVLRELVPAYEPSDLVKAKAGLAVRT